MLQIAYLLFCFGLAVINEVIIHENKVVHHWINGALHLVAWALIFWHDRNGWELAALPFIGRLFFDCLLNTLRGLPIGYVSTSPKSWIDKMEKNLFKGNGTLPKWLYLLIILALEPFILKTL